MRLPIAKSLAATLASVCALLVLAAPAEAEMRSKRIAPGLCKTTGGGKIVPIRGFPGEYIDRRLRPDIRWLKREYNIYITDGYSNSSVHSANGEHPMGLALDIVPNGRRWRKIDRLARWAEPSQNNPRPPFRWVGYNGDSGHGSGHHLHLSWNHGSNAPGTIARTVYTKRCPGKRDRQAPDEQQNDGKGGDGSGGGVAPGDGGGGGDGGGVAPRLGARIATAFAPGPIVAESDGVDRR